MAAIREVFADVPRLDEGGAPQAAGEISSGIYKGVGSGLHDISEALQRYGEQQETSQFHVGVTNAQTQAFQSWENLKRNGDITDPETVRKFNEDYQNNLSALTDNISSPAVRAHANELIASAQGEMVRRTISDHATAVGEQAVGNFNHILDNQSNVAASDPSAYEHLREQNEMLAAASGLPANKVPEATLRLNQETAKATIKGMAESGDLNLIRQAQKDVQSGRFDKDLDESQKVTTLRLLHQQEDNVIKDQRTQALLEKQQKEEASKAAVQEYQTQLTQPNLNFTQWANTILRDPRVSDADRESIIRFGHFMIEEPIQEQRAERREARVEAAEQRREQREQDGQYGEQYERASQGIVNGTIRSPTQLYDMVNEHLLSPKAVPHLITELNNVARGGDVTDPRGVLEKNAYEGIRDQFKSNGSDEAYYRQFPAIKAYDAFLRDVKKVPAQERYDPQNPNFVGRGLSFDDNAPQATNPSANPATAVVPKVVAPTVSTLGLDKIPRGAAGSEKGIAALKASKLPRAEQINEARLHGWIQ